MQTYLLPVATWEETGQTIKSQDLTGGRYTKQQRNFAEQAADRLAQNLSERTRKTWTGRVVEYTPSVRRERNY